MAQPSLNNCFQTNYQSIQNMFFLFQVLAKGASNCIRNVGFLAGLIKAWRPGFPRKESCFQVLVALPNQLDKKISLRPQHDDFWEELFCFCGLAGLCQFHGLIETPWLRTDPDQKAATSATQTNTLQIKNQVPPVLSTGVVISLNGALFLMHGTHVYFVTSFVNLQ